MRCRMLSVVVLSLLLTLLVGHVPAFPAVTIVEAMPGARPAHAQTTPPLPAGGFVSVSDGQFVQNGVPVQLKGMYYEPPNYTPQDMWRYWDSERIQRDWTMAREHMGINVVWVRLPSAIKDVSLPGEVNPEVVRRLRELLQIAGELDMKLVVTLFYDYHAFPMPGRNSESLNLDYLERLLDNFKEDDRLLGWDMYYRPDSHNIWNSGEKARVVSWLVRMANHTQKFATNQLVMASMSHAGNLWRPDFDANMLIDHVDVVMLRGKDDVNEIVEQAGDIRENTDKPILMYEFYWSSGPPCYANKYTETQQAIAYRSMLYLLAENVVQGALTRRMHDTDSGPLNSWDGPNFYYGLYRQNMTPKLATGEMLAYAVSPLPSLVQSSLPLRFESERPPYYTPDESDEEFPDAPRWVEGTDFYIKGDFRRAWETFGAEYSFGMPLGEAFRRPEDQVVIQYFEAGLLELIPSSDRVENYHELGRFERLMARVDVADLGLSYTEGRIFPPAPEQIEGAEYFEETGYYLDGEFRRIYRRVMGAWRLGFPISEAMEENVNGEVVQVQYFERGKLEINPATSNFRFAPLGSWHFAERCANMP